MVPLNPLNKLRFFMVKACQNRQLLPCCKFRGDEKLQILARNNLGNELSIVRRVRLFREHKALLESLKEVIDSNKIRRDAKYMVLNHDMPAKAVTSVSESSNSGAEEPNAGGQ